MKTAIILLFCCIGFVSIAQDLPAITEQQLENLADETVEDDALYQQMAFYRKHPINLNTASAGDLQGLRIITDWQIGNFIAYRAVLGKLIDIHELQAVPGFDLVTIKKILPYVFVGPATTTMESLRERMRHGDQYFLLRCMRGIEKSNGYNTRLANHYLGDRNHLLLRYSFQYKNLLQYGLIGEKDAGEQFFKGGQKLGFDFYSFHVFASRLGKIKALALGDYVINLGQGLIQWQSLAFGKGGDVINIKRQSPTLLPYRSAGEYYFNRGAAATIAFPQMEVTVFGSYKKFTGNLDSDSVDRFTSFNSSGYHRTNLELADRHKITDLSVGGNITYQKDFFKLSLNAVTHTFSLPYKKKEEPYNYFSFSGKHLFNSSLDYHYTHNNLHLFGEVALDKTSNIAYMQGALLSVDPKVDLSFLYRNLSPAYQTLNGNAFTENSLPTNERGLYTGIMVRPNTSWQIMGYLDYYSFPFFKYRVNGPTRGWDYFIQMVYTTAKNKELSIRYRTENKPINDASVNPVINAPVARVKQNLRLQFLTRLNNLFTIKARTELVWYAKSDAAKEKGCLHFMELIYTSVSRFKANCRLQYFATDGYDSRIYAYESDLLYSFAIPAFYDKGLRYYVNASYSPVKKLTIGLRLAQSLYKDKRLLGSGLDAINGSAKTDVKCQFIYSF